jgi:hypothetical protein
MWAHLSLPIRAIAYRFSVGRLTHFSDFCCIWWSFCLEKLVGCDKIVCQDGYFSSPDETISFSAFATICLPNRLKWYSITVYVPEDLIWQIIIKICYVILLLVLLGWKNILLVSWNRYCNWPHRLFIWSRGLRNILDVWPNWIGIGLKGQCHELVVEMSPWSSRLGLNKCRGPYFLFKIRPSQSNGPYNSPSI